MKKYFVAGIALGVTVTLVAQMIVFGFSIFRIQGVNTFFSNPTVKEQSESQNSIKSETSNSNDSKSDKVPIDMEVEGFSNSSYENFDEKAYDVLEILNQNYYENIEDQELYEEAIRGMVAGIGDPYTSYFTKEEYASFNEKMEGSYEGIGVVVSYGDSEDIILVVAPFKNSPGEKAGIKPSDRIIGVDGIDVIGMQLDQVVSMIKGEKGTTVTLRVLRGEDEIDIPIKRDVIEIPTVEKEMLEGQIGYIQMSGFDLITEEQFKKALKDLEKENQKGLIIDVRNNPGGYLHICVAIVEALLDKDMLIVYTEDKTGKREELITQDRDRFEKPLVILINGNSASASEILAGAIKDHEKGLIVGETSFGKGLVQRTFDLDDKSAVKVTISKYFTPDGYYIHDIGIAPDVEVIYNPESDEDDQLNKAIEVINEMINK